MASGGNPRLSGSAGVATALAMSVLLSASIQDRRVLGSPELSSGLMSVDAPAVMAGGFIYTSGLLGLEAAGQRDQPDINIEARRALERLKAVLEAAGSSLDQAVHVSVYLKNPGDFQTMNGVYREFFPDRAPARTTVSADLPGNALIMVSAVAVPAGAPRETLHPSGWVKSPQLSYGVRAGDLVFLSGLVSRRGADDQVVPGSIGLQTRTILENAGALLRAAGLSYEDVVAARVYLADDSLFEAMNDEYRRFFPTGPPARSTAITRLINVDSSVEIALIASTVDKQLIGPTVSPSLPVSTAVRVGPRVFLSGVLGNTDTNLGDAAAQTYEVLGHITHALELAGLTPADIVDTTVYLPDLWQFDRMDRVYREIFTKPGARTTIGAKLVTRAGLVEMMATAVK